MNAILKTINERRAVRKYKNEPVYKEVIEQIIDAGRMAPSAMNQQVWKFYVVTKKDLIHLLSKDIRKSIAKNPTVFSWKNVVKSVTNISNLAHGINFLVEPDPIFHEAPVVIFITSPKDKDWAELDIGMCSQNMMLAAQSLGINTCPVGLGRFVEASEHYQALGIPKNEHVQLAIIVGHGNEVPEAKERKKDNVLFIE